MSRVEPAINLEHTLRNQFGLERFRAGQREVIEQVLSGRDVLCVMPTGGGKSLCYQLPALLLPGVTLVISPLIALMKDQVDTLNQRGLSATLINSTLDPADQRARIQEIEAGRHRLVYVAPERFRSPRFLSMMARIKPSLLAVDEAHCISEWGHDFRPDYARLGMARRQLGSPPCIALTATATDAVRRDIADQLSLNDPALFITGFDRPNLRYAAIEAGRDESKLQELRRALDQNHGPAIVYTSSRARCESVAGFLNDELRRETVVYHAGLSREQRTIAQDRFMNGEAEIVVATNAFGMGVDKAEIRSVIHFNMPGTLEAYYQEAGRAGRDGLPALCLLLHSSSDRFLQELFIENEYPPRSAVYQVYEFLRGLEDDPIEMTHAEIRQAANLDLNDSAVGTILKILDKFEAIEKFLPRENMAIIRINGEPDETGASPSLVGRLSPQANVQRIVLTGLEGLIRDRLGEPVYFRPDEFAQALGLDRPALSRALKSLTAELPIDYIPPFRGNAIRVIDRSVKPFKLKIDFATLEKRKQNEYVKLERMVQYCRSRQCRRSHILNYFGDRIAESIRCGGCDNCTPEGPFTTAVRAPVAINTAGGQEVLLKILSGIARTRGRFGKGAIAQMLHGSEAEKISRWKLDQLSTFGILRDSGFTLPEISQIIDALTRAGLVEAQEVDRFKPVLTLTEAGWRWLRDRDRAELALDLTDYLLTKLRRGGIAQRNQQTVNERTSSLAARPDRTTPQELFTEPESAPNAEPDSDPLWDRLKALRSDLARAQATGLLRLQQRNPGSPGPRSALDSGRPVRNQRPGKVAHRASRSCAAERDRRCSPPCSCRTQSGLEPAATARSCRSTGSSENADVTGATNTHQTVPGLCAGGRMDLSADRPRFFDCRSRSDPGPGSADDRSASDLDGAQRAAPCHRGDSSPRDDCRLGRLEACQRRDRATRAFRRPPSLAPLSRMPLSSAMSDVEPTQPLWPAGPIPVGWVEPKAKPTGMLRPACGGPRYARPHPTEIMTRSLV